MYDSTVDFEDKIKQWQGYPADYKVLPTDQAEMITAAENAKSANGWMWAALTELLADHGLFKNQKAAHREAKRCRIHADLGSVPRSTGDFVDTWLRVHGYRMDFSGDFTRNGRLSQHDRDYLGKKMKLWADEMKEFTQSGVDNAFDVWMRDAQDAIKANTYRKLKFDPTVDPRQTELAKFVRMIVAPGESAEETARIYRAAEVSFANFIYRVKNHIRGVMKNSCHMMPILQGKQGDGKSEAVKALCSVLDGMAASTSFDAFGDNSMTYQFSVMPVMIFEEMAGAGKADIEKLKTIMTETKKQMREAYARASTRTILSTFISTSNKDVSAMIKDDTGNRRLIQFRTQPVDRIAIQNLDYLKLWQSVDEDAVEPPKYANAQDLELIEAVQEEQRYKSPVEEWIEVGDEYKIPWGVASKALKLWDSFETFLTDSERGQAHYWSARRLGTTLVELNQAGKIKVKITRTSNSPSYAIARPENLDEAVPPVPVLRLVGERSLTEKR